MAIKFDAWGSGGSGAGSFSGQNTGNNPWYNPSTGRWEIGGQTMGQPPDSGGGGGGGGLPFSGGGSSSGAAATAAPAASSGAGAATTAGAATGGMDYWRLAQMALQAYGAYQNSKPGEFRQAPEDPALSRLRQQMIGYTQPGGSPTRNALGGILAPMLERSANSQFKLPQGKQGYQTYQSSAPKYDLSQIFGNIDRGGYVQPGSTAQTAPPAPPNVHNAGRGDRMGQTARGLLGFFGINGGEDKDIKQERETKAAYQQWLQQYGSMFTDAQGNPVPPPKNRKEYDAWYQSRYGVPAPGAKP